MLPNPQEHPASGHIRPVDQSVLDLLRQFRGLTVPELTEHLEVTATAVRQRLDRLVEADMVERTKESVGRGRPQFRYGLTALGLRYAAANYAELASALWQEVMDLPNPQLRSRMLRRVAKRMGEGLRNSLPAEGTLAQRLEATASALGRRKVPAGVNATGNLPVLEVHACPYPEIGENRHLCEMEQEMLSEAIGQSVQLDCCQLDGHDRCQFRPIAGTEVKSVSENSLPTPANT